jgi:hypothetical protein
LPILPKGLTSSLFMLLIIDLRYALAAGFCSATYRRINKTSPSSPGMGPFYKLYKGVI